LVVENLHWIDTETQAVLDSLVDSLPAEDKRLLQTAAVIGHEVTWPLLQAIAELPEEALHRELAHLQAAEFLYETRLFPERTYTFKYALTQQVAYQSFLTSTRQRYHVRLAQELETRPETVETQPELLAHHYTEAGFAAQVVGYWQRAGGRSTARSAYDGPDAPGLGRAAGQRGKADPGAVFCPAGRGVWTDRPTRRGAAPAGRGADSGGQ
jgi:predicted ATPase